MSAVAEASELIRSIAEPRPAGDTVKSAIRRAAKRVGFGSNRTKDIWYADVRRIDADEIDRLRETAARLEAERHVVGVLALRNRLATVDPDFHRDTIAALDSALRGMGADVGAVAVRQGRDR